jgi:hypothetical protein
MLAGDRDIVVGDKRPDVGVYLAIPQLIVAVYSLRLVSSGTSMPSGADERDEYQVARVDSFEPLRCRVTVLDRRLAADRH